MFTQRLKNSRNRRKFTQGELAIKVNTTKATISNYENGHSTPSNDMLIQLSDALGVSTDYLLGRSDTPNMSEQEEFEAFANDPELKRWYKELPNSKEEDLQALKQMWDIIKKNK